MFDKVEKLIGSAFQAASQNFGISEDNLKCVILSGGTSNMPCIQNWTSNHFAQKTINAGADAVALGTSRYAAGYHPLNRINNEYALVSTAQDGTDCFETIVSAGSVYPISTPTCFEIKAAAYNQVSVSVKIFTNTGLGCALACEPID